MVAISLVRNPSTGPFPLHLRLRSIAQHFGSAHDFPWSTSTFSFYALEAPPVAAIDAAAAVAPGSWCNAVMWTWPRRLVRPTQQ